jgi:molybdopterin/thiamine biosynthesis adenylyltransferase/rhodanese-related sulfurtransferase
LQRQVLFTLADVGRPKVEAAAERLQAQNPFVNYIIHNLRLTSENALEMIAQYDIVADGTDNFQTRYLVNDACVLLGKTNVYASIFRFEGQASVFNYRNEKGEWSPNYRDLFPEPPPAGMVPSCAEGGVLGVLPGILGTIQANEVIKVITGIGETLAGRLFLLDALTFETRTLDIVADPTNPLNGTNPTQKGLIDYDLFCGIPKDSEAKSIKEISVQELATWQNLKHDFQLIDVREPYEYEIANLGGLLIPLKTVAENADKISLDKKVVIHCRSGKRSGDAIRLLESRFGFQNLYNLAGGILAWSDQVDTSMAKY